MADPQTRLNEMVSKLRERGSRLTPQRMAVLEVLAASEGHPSVEQVFECVRADMPMVSLATVYKTVGLLKEMGEVLELDFSDASNRYDGNMPYPHPHLICLRCRAIVDLQIAPLNELHQEVTRETGYRVVSHRLDLHGMCPRCQESGIDGTPKNHSGAAKPHVGPVD